MTSSSPNRIVIIGASLAGASAAIALRNQGYEGELILIGEESERPYERPPLSKAVLLGDAEEPDWVEDEAFYADHAIDLRRDTTVTRIDPAAHLVVAGGEDVGYDKLLIATGSTPRRLDVPGGDLDGLFTLRNYADSLDPPRAVPRGGERLRGRRRLDRLRGRRRGPQARLLGDHGRSAAPAPLPPSSATRSARPSPRCIVTTA